MKIGVYICHCGSNISQTVNIEKVVKAIKKTEKLAMVKDYKYLCSEPGQKLIKKDIKDFKLSGIIIAACSPLMHEDTFRNVLLSAGINPFMLEIANIREHCSWVHMNFKQSATNKAIELIMSAIAKVKLLRPLVKKEVEITPSVLVIGGGIAGIQAALDIAEQGFFVYLVEKNPSIGGRMAQLDKTFPTMDCAACILAPKMAQLSRNPKITLFTYSEVINISGFIGNYKVKILKKPRYIIESKCTGCGECSTVCPIEVTNEFDQGIGQRKAIYIPFPQAVPPTFTIDEKSCAGILPKVCGKCAEKCEADAIDFDQHSQIIEVDVGTIIIATGGDTFDAAQKEEYGYGIYQDVITGLELERLLSASGPTRGNLYRPSTGKVPKRVAFIQCVGSRDENTNRYCSRICCMYAIKQARIIRERYPSCEVIVFYIDIRAFGKGFEEFYKSAQREWGVKFVRGRVAEVAKLGKKLVIRAEDTTIGKLIQWETDLVVLSIGLVPRSTTENIRKILNLSKSNDGFLLEAHPKLKPVETFNRGIFIAGTVQGPKDIPDTIAQASAAASRANALLSTRKISLDPQFAFVNTDICGKCELCINLCPFGAIKLKEKVEIDEFLCQGCGTCVSACPAEAISMTSYTKEQILNQIAEICRRS
jgi:heterodisulfide reductase subunit A